MRLSILKRSLIVLAGGVLFFGGMGIREIAVRGLARGNEKEAAGASTIAAGSAAAGGGAYPSEVRAVSRLPGARTAPYPDCYHTVFFRGSADDPGEEFVGILLGFGDREATGSGFLETGDRMQLDRVPFEEAPDEVTGGQLADDLESFAFPTYWIRTWRVNRDLGLERGARRLLEQRQDLFVFNREVGMLFPPVGDFYSFQHWNPRHGEPAPSVAAVTAFARDLARVGVTLVFCPVPERRNVYADWLTRGEYDPARDGPPHPEMSRAYDYLRGQGVEVVDLPEAFARDRAQAEPLAGGSPLFLEGDHHWSPRAARLAAKEVARLLDSRLDNREWPRPAALSERRIEWENPRPSLRDHEVLRELGLEAPNPSVAAWEVVAAGDDPDPVDWSSVRDEGRVIVIGDSHADFPNARDTGGAPAGFHAHLARLLAEPVRLLRRSGDGKNATRRDFLAQRLFEDVECVVWLVREREIADPQWTRYRLEAPADARASTLAGPAR